MSTLTARQEASRTRSASAPTFGRSNHQVAPRFRFAHRGFAAATRWLEQLGETRRRRRAYRRSLRELQVLSDRTLGDIGLDRSALMSAAMYRDLHRRQ